MHAISPSSHPVIYHVIEITANLARTVYSVAIKCFAACQFLFTQGKQLFNWVVDSLSLNLSELIDIAANIFLYNFRREPMGDRAGPSNHELPIPLQRQNLGHRRREQIGHTADLFNHELSISLETQNLEQSLWERFPTLMKEDRRLGAERLKDAELVAQMRKEDSRANPGPQIISWLNRIQLMADYDTKKQIIEQQINGFLLQAEKDPVFRETFLLTIDQAATTCGDRMAVSMLHVGLNAKKAKFLQEPKPSKEQMQEFAEFIIRGPWALQKLQEYAQQVVDAIEANMRLGDAKSDGKCKESIEVFLGLPIKLKQRLRLQFDVDAMLYEGLAKALGVTDEAVDTAGSMIEEQIAANKASILSEDPDWQTMISKYNPEGYELIIATRNERAEQLPIYASRTQWQDVESFFIAQLAILTGEILSGTED